MIRASDEGRVELFAAFVSGVRLTGSLSFVPEVGLAAADTAEPAPGDAMPADGPADGTDEPDPADSDLADAGADASIVAVSALADGVVVDSGLAASGLAADWPDSGLPDPLFPVSGFAGELTGAGSAAGFALASSGLPDLLSDFASRSIVTGFRCDDDDLGEPDEDDFRANGLSTKKQGRMDSVPLRLQRLTHNR